jgi:hypothetical protein
MKYIYILAFGLFTFGYLDGQVLNQDAEGNSSIVYSGGTLGFDVGKTELSLTYNNLYSPLIKFKKTKLLWGIGAKGKTENGIAELFNGGNFLPSVEANGVLGLAWNLTSKGKNGTIVWYQYEIKRDQLYEEIDKTIEDYTLYISVKAALLDSSILKDSVLLLQGNSNDLITFIDKKISKSTTSKKDKEALDDIKSRTTWYVKTTDAQDVKLNKLFEADTDSFNGKRFVRHLLYFSPSITGTGFDYFKDSSGTFLNYFGKKTSINWSFNIGYNHQNGRVLFGAAVGLESLSNLSELKTKDYSISSSQKDSTTNEILSTTTKKTAYTLNDYYTYMRINVLIDFAYFMPVEDGNSGSIIWNGYGRLFVPITETIKAQPSMNFGVGAYWLDKTGKFTGGIYCQVNDIWNSRNQVTTPDPWYEKLSFGLITRFNFGALPSYK